MKIPLRSSTTTAGRLMAGARSLWRANGMTEQQFSQPIIGIVNSFSELVPGHVHLHTIGRKVKAIIESQGCFAPEFNTMALDDGIAMGHGGMLYSLPSRELIADTVEYCVNGHCLDAMICISNCDKITPGMLMAAMRLNIPTIFVSGGPMEAGKGNIDLVTAMVAGADKKVSDRRLLEIEKSACRTCGSCSGMFTANSMNCIMEAFGLALPGNGSVLATHEYRLRLFEEAAKTIVKMARKYYFKGDSSVLPRQIASEASFKNAMRLDVAMGGSTNTVLHLLAIAHEAGVNFTMKDVDEISRTTPVLCKVAPSSSYHMEDVNRAGGVMGILGRLDRAGLLDTSVEHVALHEEPPVYTNSWKNLEDVIRVFDIKNGLTPKIYFAAPAGNKSIRMGSQSKKYATLDLDRETGCIRDVTHAYSQDGGLAVLYGNLAEEGCIVKTAGVDESMLKREGRAIIFDSQEDAIEGILGGKVQPGHAVVIRYEGPKGGPGMQEMLYPTSYLKAKKLDETCFMVTDGRFSGGTSGPCIGHVSPEAASGGLIGLLKDGDLISYDIPRRIIIVDLSKAEIDKRTNELIGVGRRPNRNRTVSAALRKYAAFVTSASTGAIQLVP